MHKGEGLGRRIDRRTVLTVAAGVLAFARVLFARAAAYRPCLRLENGAVLSMEDGRPLLLGE